MVRRECGMSAHFESGEENFQMSAEITCGERILSYVKSNKTKISKTMMEPEFLDIIIERFARESAMVSADQRAVPPFDNKLLTIIALIKLGKKTSLEQIMIFLKFIFPALRQSEIMEVFRREFSSEIVNCDWIEKESEQKQPTYGLQESSRDEALDEIRSCSLENLVAIELV